MITACGLCSHLWAFLLVSFNQKGLNGFLANYGYLTIFVVATKSYKLQHFLPCVHGNKQFLPITFAPYVFFIKKATVNQ